MTKQEKIEIGHGNIAKALAAAQAEMGRAIKQSNNPHFRSKYADLGNVMDACMDALTKHGISVIQPIRENDYGRFVVTIFLHESGETLENPVPLITGKNDMQGLGSAYTYARRYGLMGLAGIAPEDDDGNAAVESVKNAPPDTPSREAINTAKTSLENAESVDQLRAIWEDLPKPIQHVAAVITAKNKRKAELESPKEKDAPNLSEELGDEIPHQE